ncbi:membrane protein insertion efficiency factor YidD [Breoghania sp. JC706]|uniref:membrane protein insertion efficiency factor YidD n=1 Tax=Breoghania sp. JC706 TaxID=3117732 RepID=UPI00300A63E6
MKTVAILLIRLYRYTFSALFGRSCRYQPTCSSYTEEAIVRFGLWPGGWMGLARILRCNPFGASGYDPVPDDVPGNAHWYMPWRYGRWTGRHIDPTTRIDLP